MASHVGDAVGDLKDSLSSKPNWFSGEVSEYIHEDCVQVFEYDTIYKCEPCKQNPSKRILLMGMPPSL